MRRGRILGVTAAAFAAALVAVSAAYAATPQEIYADLAANGQLTKDYSAADLKAAALDAASQGYGGVEEQTMRPVVQQAAAATATQTMRCVGIDSHGNKIMRSVPAGTSVSSHACERIVCSGTTASGQPTYGAANASNTTSSGAPRFSCVKGTQFTKTNTAPAATLPFTGVQLGVFAAVGIALLAGGLLLRRAARD